MAWCIAAELKHAGEPEGAAAAALDNGDADEKADADADKPKKKRVRKQVKKLRRPGPRTTSGRHHAFVWLSALKERIPLSMTLAISYLSCYIARESIIPNDIRKWALNGQLPYLAAFVEISKSVPNHISDSVVETQVCSYTL
jgi:hypothetical protein